jgi:hypothetical protein
MSTESWSGERAEALRTEGPGAAVEPALAPAGNGELTDDELEAVAAGKTFVGGPRFGGGFFFRRRFF